MSTAAPKLKPAAPLPPSAFTRPPRWEACDFCEGTGTALGTTTTCRGCDGGGEVLA